MLLSSLLILMNYCNLPAFTKLFAQTNSNDGSTAKTGYLYVGSAYGEDGIWGRWTKYVSTNGHGNNKTLKELVKADKDYADNFKFSISVFFSFTKDCASETQFLKS
jgi:hypothetical protein